MLHVAFGFTVSQFWAETAAFTVSQFWVEIVAFTVSALLRAGSQQLSMQQFLPKTAKICPKQNFEIPPKIEILVFFKNKNFYV
jgi:hypothetical protein